jgi:predicted phage tail protein
MSKPLVTVHLHGKLAEQYGAVHYFDVRTPSEAVRALSANYPGFRAAFLETQIYHVLVDGDWRDGDSGVLYPISREVHFVPRTEGALETLALAAVTAVFPALAGTLAAQIIAGVLIAALFLGIAWAMGAFDEKKEGDDKSDSYAFTGQDNVAQQGAPVPIIYGRVHVGSVVASASLEAGDQIYAGSGVTAFGGYDATPQIIPAPPRGGPPIVLQRLGPKDAQIKRLGPVGWDYIGARLYEELGKRRWLDIFVSPDRAEAWDYWRGFGPYSERALLP